MTTLTSRRSRHRPRVRTGWLLCVPGVLSLMTACDPGIVAVDDALHPRPGDTLLDVLSAVHVAEFPETNLPPDVVAVLARPDPRATMRLRASTWRREAERVESMLVLVGLEGHGQVWRTLADPAGFDVSRSRIVYGGKELERSEVGSVVIRDPLWHDLESGTMVIWLGNSTQFVLVTREEPRDLLVEFVQNPTATARRYELDGRPVLGDDADGLLRSEESHHVSRRALMLPAPGVLEVDVTLTDVDTLSVATALARHAVGARKQRLLLHRGHGDGATVAVDVVHGGRTERLWTERLEPGMGWTEAEVDLSAYAGSAVTLRLVTDPGAGGDPWFDYAFWADLTFSGPDTRAVTRPHVVLIDIDTLRPDRLGCYGHQLPTSPRLDAWAARNALVFTDCTSTSSWTLPATVSMLTGLAVHQHGIQRPRQRLVPALTTLAAHLRDVGYETRAMVAGGYISASFGFDQGFELFDSAQGPAPDWRPLLTWLDGRRSDRPAFVFLHTFAVHAPYAADERFVPEGVREASRLAGQPVRSANVFVPFRHGALELEPADREYISRLYDAGIRRLDDMLGEFLEGLEQRFTSDELLVIITSDHGEELFEHGGFSHGTTLYAEMLSVPMLMQAPQVEPGVADVQVSVLDIVPTVFDLAGVPPRPELPGRSMLAILPAQTLRIAELNGVHKAVQWGSRKLIEARRGAQGVARVQLFDLGDDPVEQRNLADEAQARVLDLRARARDFVTRHPEGERPASDVVLDADERRALEALGYLEDG